MEAIIGIALGIFLGVIWSFNNVTPDSFQKAVDKCQNNFGLERVVYNTIGSDSAYCVNGAKFKLKESSK